MSGAQINTNKRRTSAVAVAIITTIIATIVTTPVVVTIVASWRRYVFFSKTVSVSTRKTRENETHNVDSRRDGALQSNRQRVERTNDDDDDKNMTLQRERERERRRSLPLWTKDDSVRDAPTRAQRRETATNYGAGAPYGRPPPPPPLQSRAQWPG